MTVFLSGAFFDMPSPKLFELGRLGDPGHLLVGVFDLLPGRHALAALRRLFSDAGRGTLAPSLAMAALAAAIFVAAVFFFHRRVMRLG